MRHIHSLGYVARCLLPELFHLDAAWRHLFMADISNIRIDPTSLVSHTRRVRRHARRGYSNVSQGLPGTSWSGGSLYAPLSFHEKDAEGKPVTLTRGDELQVREMSLFDGIDQFGLSDGIGRVCHYRRGSSCSSTWCKASCRGTRVAIRR